MKKTIGGFALMLVALAAAVPLEAQARRGVSVEDQVTVLTERLELDEEQVPQVHAILQAQVEAGRERFQGLRGSMDRSAAMEIMQELQAETEAKLAEVLSDEQLEKYKEFVAEQRARRRPPLSR